MCYVCTSCALYCYLLTHSISSHIYFLGHVASVCRSHWNLYTAIWCSKKCGGQKIMHLRIFWVGIVRPKKNLFSGCTIPVMHVTKFAKKMKVLCRLQEYTGPWGSVACSRPIGENRRPISDLFSIGFYTGYARYIYPCHICQQGLEWCFE